MGLLEIPKGEAASSAISPTDTAVSLSLCELMHAGELLAQPSMRITPDRNADWVAASVLRLYHKTNIVDPMRADMQVLGATLNKAMRTFAATEQRERRNAERNIQKRRQE